MLALLQIIAGLFVIAGGCFSLIAGLGILRFPDVYSRMHAASKAGTVASGLMLLALAILAPDVGVATRALAGIAFFLLTAPIAAHLLARVAYSVGIEMWDGSVIDDLADAAPESREDQN